MLREVGARFKFEGANQAINKINRLKGSFSSLKGQASNTLSNMKKLSGPALAVMAANMVAVTGAALGLKEAFQLVDEARSKVTKQSAELITLGMTPEEISRVEKQGRVLQQAYADVHSDEFVASAYDVKSAMSELTAEQVAGVTSVGTTLAKTTKMLQTQSTEVLGAIYGASYYLVKDQYSPVEYMEKASATLYKAVQLNKTTGPRLKAGLRTAITPLAQAGWELEKIIGALGVLNTAGLSGEMSGTGMAAIERKARAGAFQIYLERNNLNKAYKSLDDKGKERVEKRVGGQLEAMFKKDPVKYFKWLNMSMQDIQKSGKDASGILSSAFGDEARKALQILMGKYSELDNQIKQLHGSTYQNQLDVLEQKQQGWYHRITLLRQAYSTLKEEIAVVLEGYMLPLIDRLKGKLDVAIGLWRGLFHQQGDLGYMDTLIKAGDGTTYYIENVLTPLRNIMNKLKLVFKGFWAQLTGSGSNMSGAESLIQSFSSALNQLNDQDLFTKGKNIAQFFQDVATGMSTTVDMFKKAVNTAISIFKWVEDKINAIRGFLGKDPISLSRQVLRDGGNHIVDPLTGPKRIGVAVEGWLYNKGQQAWDGLKGGVGQWNQFGAENAMAYANQYKTQPTTTPAPNVDIQVEPPQIQVQIGNQVIEDMVVRTLRQERARYRNQSGTQTPGLSFAR